MLTHNNIWLYMRPKSIIDLSALAGKWLCFGKKAEIHRYAREINELVEAGVFRIAKMSRKLPEYDCFPDKHCVLCVYTSDDEEEKQAVKRRLKSIGLYPVKWKAKEETERDWRKDGKLYGEFMREKNKRNQVK
jgi:hypothetical protein